MRRHLIRLVRHIGLLIALLVPGLALAHEVRPAYLEMIEQPAGQWSIAWKQPVMGDKAVRLVPRLSNQWLEARPVDETLTGEHYIRRWRILANRAELESATLEVDGLERTITDVLVHVRTADGDGFDEILRRGHSRVTIAIGGQGALAVPAYLWLGVHHILTGIDHLLFVAGLLLLVGGGWRLVGTITSFTVAHSLTLAVSTLGIVHAPVAVIEALVAWSIVFVAFELTRGEGRGTGVTKRLPWLIALAFGLLHGFAFAGALAETGLPEADIPMALLLFNLGVELGQLLFVGAVLLAFLAWRRHAGPRLPGVESLFVRKLAPYVMGCYAAFLLFERTAAAFA